MQFFFGGSLVVIYREVFFLVLKLLVLRVLRYLVF